MELQPQKPPSKDPMKLVIDEGFARTRIEPTGFQVDRIVLFRSHLRRPAPRYEPIATFALGG